MLDSETFVRLKQLIHRESGISLSGDKLQLVENRLQKRMRSLRLSDPARYLSIVETDASGAELRELLNVISTNVTYFWREERHFEVLSQYLEQLRARHQREVRIWCAAASTGEEPYTIAMIARQVFGDGGAAVRVLATDISTKALERALDGRYQREQVSRLPRELADVSFTEEPSGILSIVPPLRSMVTFRRLNLAKTPYPLRGPFDVIFCRNVMIYFDSGGRAGVVREVERLLAPQGLFFISHSENLLGIAHRLSPYSSAVYARGGRS